MRFIPYDDNTYLVRSRTREGHHIIDLQARTCSCEGFEFYHTCEHLRRALRRFGLSHVVTTSVTVDFSQFM